jgi:hypothetical protein
MMDRRNKARGSWIQEREEDNLVWMNIEGMNQTCRRRYEEKAVGICIERHQRYELNVKEEWI